MLGTEIANVTNELDQIAAAFNSDDTEKLMELTGQSSGSEKSGPPRLSINYDVATDDGKALTRGDWKMYVDGRFIYASEVVLRPLLRMYEYSVWDNEANDGRGGFSCKSVQKPTFSGTFPDTSGGNKCGRLTRDEEEGLDKNDPSLLLSRSVVCNQVIYGRISGDFTDADGNAVRLSNEPVISYFKKSGFIPMSNFINGLAKQRKLMAHCEILLRTEKQRKGSVTYWTPLPALNGSAEITEDDKELFGMFRDMIESHNSGVMSSYREAAKMIVDDGDADLAADFQDANAS
jgi:hypothetical protein